MSERRCGTMLTARNGRARRHARGAAYMWFLLVALPLVAFGSVLAVDITRIIVAAREASNVAEAAAVAGAQQFASGNTWELDHSAARNVAEQTVDYSSRPDVSAMRSEVTRRVAVVTLPDSSYAGERVTVTIDYQVPGLVFMPLLAVFTGNDESQNVRNLTVSRSADVCIPGRYDPTGGSCVRPVP